MFFLIASTSASTRNRYPSSLYHRALSMLYERGVKTTTGVLTPLMKPVPPMPEPKSFPPRELTLRAGLFAPRVIPVPTTVRSGWLAPRVSPVPPIPVPALPTVTSGLSSLRVIPVPTTSSSGSSPPRLSPVPAKPVPVSPTLTLTSSVSSARSAAPT